MLQLKIFLETRQENKMKRIIKCKVCKTTIEVEGKKPKNTMNKIFPALVDSNHFKHNCKKQGDQK